MRQQPINVRCENAAGRPGQIREFILAVSQGTTLVAPSKFNDIFLTIYQTFTLLVPYCLFSDHSAMQIAVWMRSGNFVSAGRLISRSYTLCTAEHIELD